MNKSRVTVTVTVEIDASERGTTHSRVITKSHSENLGYNAAATESAITEAAKQILTEVTSLYGDIRDNSYAPASVRGHSRTITASSEQP